MRKLEEHHIGLLGVALSCVAGFIFALCRNCKPLLSTRVLSELFFGDACSVAVLVFIVYLATWFILSQFRRFLAKYGFRFHLITLLAFTILMGGVMAPAWAISYQMLADGEWYELPAIVFLILFCTAVVLGLTVAVEHFARKNNAEGQSSNGALREDTRGGATNDTPSESRSAKDEPRM